MNKDELIKQWKEEEKISLNGWDFSHLDNRYEEEDDIPWNYKDVILSYLHKDMNLLDIDTGGGEFLLFLNHPYENTSATENYEPNVDLCISELSFKGIDFRKADGKEKLPFEDESFHIVINRHGDYKEEEIYRILKKGGLFITQQVGAENDRELVEFLMGDIELPFPEQYLKKAEERLKKSGFIILESDEHFGNIKFFDTGALVWFAHIIEWEFPDFSVEKYSDKLFQVEEIIKKNKEFAGKTHRYYIVAQK